MYLASLASDRPDVPAYVMHGSGDTLTYAELEARSNQVAHLLRSRGVPTGGSLILVTENRVEWPVLVAAGMRSGLFVTPLNWHLKAEEIGGMLREALAATGPSAVVTTATCAETVLAALDTVDSRPVVWSLDPGVGEIDVLADATAGMPSTPIADERLGARCLYSGGTTGTPKAFRQELVDLHPADAPPRNAAMNARMGYGPDTVFLSPAPSYHTAPFTFQLTTLTLGGTVVCLERFDAEQALATIERHRVTHAQWVPTMLQRLLQLPERTRARYDLSSLRAAGTTGAPCAHEVKAAIMAWWGPILHEYYGSSEGYGHTYVAPEEALAKPGTVGRTLSGAVHVTDADGTRVPPGTVGRVWFEPAGTVADRSAAGGGGYTHSRGWRSVGDLGYLDADGFLFLVGRESHTIISGGVNIYPIEIEDALLSHPKVVDAAVIGVPDPEFGEQVKAVVEVDGEVSAQDLIEFCQHRLARYKTPKSVDFVDRLPRLPTGKLNKDLLRKRYVAVPR